MGEDHAVGGGGDSGEEEVRRGGWWTRCKRGEWRAGDSGEEGQRGEVWAGWRGGREAGLEEGEHACSLDSAGMAVHCCFE